MSASVVAPFEFGPVELFVVEFDGTEADSRVLAALAALDEGGQVRLVDLVVVARLADGGIRVTEPIDLAAHGDDQCVSAELVADGLIGEEDIEDAAEGLLPGTGVALAAFEMRWATALSSAVSHAGGRVAHVALVPAPAINELVAQAHSDTALTRPAESNSKERA